MKQKCSIGSSKNSYSKREIEIVFKNFDIEFYFSELEILCRTEIYIEIDTHELHEFDLTNNFT